MFNLPIPSPCRNVGITTTQSPGGQDGADGGQWLELVRSFRGAKVFWVGDGLMTDILRALDQADRGQTTVLPALSHLRVENPKALMEPSWDALQSFITSRSLSDRPAQVNVTLHQCDICHACFRDEEGLESHLVGKHAYRTMCSYCTDFEFTPRRIYQFQGHLESQHPEVVRRHDGSINSLFTIPQLDRFVNRHSSLLPPDVVPPSTTAMATRSQ